MANKTSNEYHNEQKCFKRRSQIANYKTTKSYEGVLFCREVQVNEVMSVQVQLLLSVLHYHHYTVQVQLLLPVLHITFTPCHFKYYSLSAAQRHYTNQARPSDCCLPIYTIRTVNK